MSRSLFVRRAWIIQQANKRRRGDTPEDLPMPPPGFIMLLDEFGAPFLDEFGYNIFTPI